VLEVDKKQKIKLKWSYATTDDFENGPTLDESGKYVYFSTSNDVHCLNAQKGSTEWVYHAPFNEKFATEPLVTNQNGNNKITVYIAGSMNLYSLNGVTGKLNWKMKTKKNANSIATYKDVLFVHDSSSIFALKLLSKKRNYYKSIWKKQVAADNSSSLIIIDQKKHSVFYEEHNTIYALNAKNGKVKQQFSYPKNEKRGAEGHLISGFGAIEFDSKNNDVLLYFGTRSGYIYSLNPAKKGLKWKFTSSEGVSIPPVIANNLVYFGDTINVYALKKSNGKLGWQSQVDSLLTGLSLSHDGTLYAASQNKVFAFFKNDAN